QIVWRRGLDLHPLDVADDSHCTWLETLVWPEHHERLHRLRAAIAVARHDPPRIERGNLLEDLPALARRAPERATLAVDDSAALAYVAWSELREAFARNVRVLGAVWISSESPGTFTQMTASGGRRGAFLLSVDGVPRAWTDPHGAWIRWVVGREDKG